MTSVESFCSQNPINQCFTLDLTVIFKFDTKRLMQAFKPDKLY